MIRVSLTFAEVKLQDGSEYLVNPIQATNGFDFTTMTQDDFLVWKQDNVEHYFDLTVVRVPSDEAKSNGATLLGRLHNRFGGDCEVERIKTLSYLGTDNAN